MTLSLCRIKAHDTMRCLIYRRATNNKQWKRKSLIFPMTHQHQWHPYCSALFVVAFCSAIYCKGEKIYFIWILVELNVNVLDMKKIFGIFTQFFCRKNYVHDSIVRFLVEAFYIVHWRGSKTWKYAVWNSNDYYKKLKKATWWLCLPYNQFRFDYQ